MWSKAQGLTQWLPLQLEHASLVNVVTKIFTIIHHDLLLIKEGLLLGPLRPD